MPLSRRPIALAAAAALMLPVSGCGRERLSPPDAARPLTGVGSYAVEYPQAGVRFQAPAGWPFERGRDPLVTSAASGTATVAVWRYPRSEPLPRDEATLEAAREALVDAAKARDPRFALDRSRRVEVDGARGVELLGTQRVAGHERRVRSTHLYAKGAELVIDAYAAPRDFAAVDREVVRPLVRSFKIDPPRP